MTARRNQDNFPEKQNCCQAIIRKVTAVTLCGFIAWGIQHPAISTWAQATVLIITEKENLEKVKKAVQKTFQKPKA